jgi:hypothetical protein
MLRCWLPCIPPGVPLTGRLKFQFAPLPVDPPSVNFEGNRSNQPSGVSYLFYRWVVVWRLKSHFELELAAVRGSLTWLVEAVGLVLVRQKTVSDIT